MSITATPTLTVAGVDVLGSTDLLAVDELSVTWGRSSVLEAPTPATASLAVLDRSAGATLAARSDLIGQLVLAGWVSGSTSGTFFRGRITDTDAVPAPGGGFLLGLSASSKEVDAGNYVNPPNTTWPTGDTFTARANRIMGMMPAGTFAGGATLPTMSGAVVGPEVDTTLGDFGTYPARSEDVSGRSALELLAELWASTYPVPLVYDPATDGFTYAPRHRLALSPAVTLAPDTAFGGLFTAHPTVAGGRTLDGRVVAGYGSPLAQSLESRLTRVEVTYLNTIGNADTTTTATTVDTPLESTIGRRTLQVTTIIGGSDRVDTYAASIAKGWAAVAGAEGRARTPGTITVSTALAPFTDTGQAAALLRGRETGDLWFLASSWLPRLAARPLIAVLGGRIGYAAGEWTIDLDPQRVADPAPGAPATIGNAGTATLAQIHPSVTFGDLAFVESIAVPVGG